mmetsp:Transcript_1036/g.1295  ORF Transcript_1036/g.1295 Transcript_1036/m.1295 type:complete len:1790 (+) Transcript_1036:84-5453(+)
MNLDLPTDDIPTDNLKSDDDGLQRGTSFGHGVLRASFMFEELPKDETDKTNQEENEDLPYSGTMNKGTSFQNGALRASFLFGEVNPTKPPPPSESAIPPKILQPLQPSMTKDLPTNNIFAKKQVFSPVQPYKPQSLQSTAQSVTTPTASKKLESPFLPDMQKGSVTVDVPEEKSKKDIKKTHLVSPKTNLIDWFLLRQTELSDFWFRILNGNVSRIPMDSDGLISLENIGFYQKSFYLMLYAISLIVSILAIFGSDLLVIFFPTISDYHVGVYLFSLWLFLVVEIIVCTVAVKGYLFSSFFVLDCLTMFAVTVELSQTEYSALHLRSTFIEAVQRFTLLRSGRMTRIGAKMGGIATTRVGKAVVWSRRPSTHHAQDSAHGFAGQFGRKGYEDGRALYLYIREKFTQAFLEVEADGKCTRDDFTMITRSLVKLELEPEEEEVLYRIMTVFGRSQEMKFMEDQLNKNPDIEPTQLGLRRALIKRPPVTFALPPTTISGSTDTTSSGGAMKRQRSASMDPSKTKFIIPPNLASIEIPSKPRKLSSIGKSASTSFFSRSPSPSQVYPAHLFTTSETELAESEIANQNANNRRKSPPNHLFSGFGHAHPDQSAHNNTDNSFSIHSDWESLMKKMPSLSSSKRNLFRQQSSDLTATGEEGIGEDLFLSSEARLERSRQDAEMFEKMKEWVAMRLKISMALKPLENDAMVWGLQLFRQVDDVNTPMTMARRNHTRLDERGCIGVPEFETRLQEALIVDGSNIYEAIHKMATRYEMKSFMKKSNKRKSSKLKTNFGGIFKNQSISYEDGKMSDSPNDEKRLSDASSRSGSNTGSRSNSETSLTMGMGSLIGADLASLAWGGFRRTSSGDISNGSIDSPLPIQIKPRRTSSEMTLSGRRRRSLSDNHPLSRVNSESMESSSNFEMHDPVLKSADTLEREEKTFEQKKSEEGGFTFVPRRASSMEAYRMRLSHSHDSKKPTSDDNRLSGSIDESVESDSGDSTIITRNRNSVTSMSDDLDDTSSTGSIDSIKKKFGTIPKKIRSFSIDNRTRMRVESEGGGNKPSWRSRLRVPLVSTSNDHSHSSLHSSENATTPKIIMTVAEKSEIAKKGLLDVVEKVKSQMKAKMKDEIISDSKFGSGDNMANRIGRGTTRVAMLGVFFMFIVAPILTHNSQSCGSEVGGLSGFRMVKSRIKALIDSPAKVMTDAQCDVVNTDESIQSMVYEYRLLDPKPFLIQYYGCVLYEDPDLLTYKSSDNSVLHHKLREEFVSYLPCRLALEEHGQLGKWNADTIIAFDVMHVKQEAALYNIALSCVLIMSLMVMSYALGRDTAVLTEVIVSPLTQLAKDMDRVSRFDLSSRRRTGSRGSGKSLAKAAEGARRSVRASMGALSQQLSDNDDATSSIAEVRSIQQSFATMRTTIQSFAKYVPQDVVYQLVRAKAGMAKLAVEEQEVTILFSDIENFTKICESMGVGDELLNLMSDYFTAMTDIITSSGGCLLEFIGDAVLAVWNAPNPEEMHAVQAVTAALEMQHYLDAMTDEWNAKGYPRVRIRCGIHTAKVLVGNIGAPNRMKYGVLGDGVNTASRLEETNKRYATRTLISEATFKHINGEISGSRLKGGGVKSSTIFISRPVDRVIFKGKTKPTTLYEIVGFKQDRSVSRAPSAGSDDVDIIRSPSAPLLAERVEKAIAGAKGSEDFSHIVREESVSIEEMKRLMMEAHNTAWTCFMARDFHRGRRLFALVDEMQRELGPRTVVSGLPFDFGDGSLGDCAAIRLRDRCDSFIKKPPPADWDGAEVLADKHF